MKDNKKAEIIENWINGNISDFRASVKRASKKDMLDIIEYYSGNYGKRHEIINAIYNALTNYNK